ncbi:MAG TPA: SAM-dependent methyltransferase [Candidatus Acidoferrales bacterium]|jgi:methyltransferase (TIGR00027 family)|nr:SAM-dependent methyltransferase [Candidatus Acidoferrales bacterium]
MPLSDGNTVPTESSSAPSDEDLIRNVSDTARLVAIDRAVETERPDALFRDPFARRLAGERGARIAKSNPLGGRKSGGGWPIVTRTYVIDRMIQAHIAQGGDAVINLAAGLDTRPYRMDMPSSLQWIEVDLPEILAHKEEILRGEKPVCSLESVRLDLSNVPARRELLARLGRQSRRALVITEGLVVYLGSEEVALLAQDLAAQPSFRSWILDLVSPKLLATLQRRMTSNLKRAAPFKFAPQEGPAFFARFGWTVVEANSLLREAARLNRLPFYLLPISWLPDSHGTQPQRPWGGVCLFARSE